jgi:hypothetical protein
MSLVAAALLLTLSGSARAGSHGTYYPSGKSYNSFSHGNTSSYGWHPPSYNYVSRIGISPSYGTSNWYRQLYGRPFSYGFYYSGPYHNQWTYRCWYGHYGCYCYWCPSTLCWYYWCAPQNCYYPISYIGIAAPGATAAPAAAGLAGLPTPPVGVAVP